MVISSCLTMINEDGCCALFDINHSLSVLAHERRNKNLNIYIYGITQTKCLSIVVFLLVLYVEDINIYICFSFIALLFFLL